MKILAVSHSAFLGAPSVLLTAAKGLSKKGYRFYFVLFEGGQIAGDFAAIGPVFMWRPPGRVTGIRSAVAAAASALVHSKMIAALRAWSPDVVYMNSYATVSFLGDAVTLSKPVVFHIHELQQVAEQYGHGRAREFRSVPAVYLACSSPVRAYLRSGLGLPAEKIEDCPEPVDPERIENGLRAPAPPAGDELIVGACGYPSFRKGTDLWFELAGRLCRMMPDQKLRFVWIGPRPNEAWSVSETAVEFTGEMGPEMYAVMRTFDVFVLPSREDPMPLACLEAMYLRKPVVCFAGCGGAEEAVSGGGGVAVRKLDVQAMADEVKALLLSPEKRVAMGEAGERTVRARHLPAPMIGQLERLFANVVGTAR